MTSWTRAAVVGWAVAWPLVAGVSVGRAAEPEKTNVGHPAPTVTIGSKKFTESVVLGEILVHLTRAYGAVPRHLAEMGGTRFVWNSLKSGEIDLYPEYTGTLTQEIFAGREIDDRRQLRRLLAEQGVGMSRPLGFNNTYAIAMRPEMADRLGITTISDLRQHPSLSFGVSREFMDRADGWPALKRCYRLPQTNVRGMDHDLSYRALKAGQIDLISAYSTDAEIAYYGFRVLEDDLRHFPRYDAVVLYRLDLPQRWPEIKRVLDLLAGSIDERRMMQMNERVKIAGIPDTLVASRFVNATFGLNSTPHVQTFQGRLLANTRDHLLLVAVSLAAAIATSLPLGILAARYPTAGQFILGAVGVLWTIPTLVLFVFMIPIFGVGSLPAIVALYLYSLLPIVRNTHAGLKGIPTSLLESADALGLPRRARLRLVELPLASRSILSGIKIAAVINVGTAALGALIGAGGYGQPIVTGIRLDNPTLIYGQGAIPNAILSLAVLALAELAERRLVPKGLRLKPSQ